MNDDGEMDLGKLPHDELPGTCNGQPGSGNGMNRCMLLGQFHVEVDENGCVMVPEPWRGAFGESRRLYLVNRERCLGLAPQETFDAWVALELKDAKEAALRDRMKKDARLVEIDDQWRIHVDDDFLAFAEIQGAAVLVGEMRSATLWSPEERMKYAEHMSAMLVDFTPVGL